MPSATCSTVLAKSNGTITSYDLNFRSKLWNSKKAQEVTKDIIGYVDCLIGNEEDMQKGLGVKGPEVTKKAESKLDPEVFFGMIEATVKQFPNLKGVATTLREAHSTNRHEQAGFWGEAELPRLQSHRPRALRQIRRLPQSQLSSLSEAARDSGWQNARLLANDPPRMTAM